MAQPMTFVGIDVSKATLDVASRPTASGSTVANDDAGIAMPPGRARASLYPTYLPLYLRSRS